MCDGKIRFYRDFSGLWAACDKCRVKEKIAHSELWKRVLEMEVTVYLS
jgi:hypothetical protein